jgi:hypothetical protein
MRINELVKTYRLLSDPQAPAWNVKFVGALALFALVAAGTGGLYYVTRVDDAAAPGAVANTAGPEQEVHSAYVGVPPATPVTDASAADAALLKWKAEHPGAVIVSQEPVASSVGGVAGYNLRYRA